MSLIGDALRKARQEAADRESERRGVLFSARISDSPGRSNLGLGLALGALIAVAATIAGGATVWWILGKGEAPVEPMAEVGQTTAAVADDPDPGQYSVSEQGQDQQSAAATGAGTVAAKASESGAESESESVAESETVLDPVPDGEAADGSHSDQAPSPSASTHAIETGFAGVEDGEEIYILEATLGGVVLSLDYIVSRSDDPFAEINGVEVHVGGVVDGYRVKAIEKDRVRLSDGRRTIVLRVP